MNAKRRLSSTFSNETATNNARNEQKENQKMLRLLKLILHDSENDMSASIVVRFLVYLAEKYIFKAKNDNGVSICAKKALPDVLSVRCLYRGFPAEPTFASEWCERMVPQFVCWLCRNKSVTLHAER